MTYQYRCQSCEHSFDLSCKMSEAMPETQCPKCSSVAHKLITGGGGFLLRGSGWYKTDYASKKEREKRENDRQSG